MSKHNLFFGRRGEDKAVRFLKDNGYRILSRNYRTRLGEIDIVAKDKSTFCFVEVKTRLNENFGLPVEAITDIKRKQIIKAATAYLKENSLLDKNARFDVVSIMGTGEEQEIKLIKNAFNLGGV